MLELRPLVEDCTEDERKANIRFEIGFVVWESNCNLVFDVLKTPGLKIGHLPNVISAMNAVINRQITNRDQSEMILTFIDGTLPQVVSLTEKILTNLQREGPLKEAGTTYGVEVSPDSSDEKRPRRHKVKISKKRTRRAANASSQTTRKHHSSTRRGK